MNSDKFTEIAGSLVPALKKIAETRADIPSKNAIALVFSKEGESYISYEDYYDIMDCLEVSNDSQPSEDLGKLIEAFEFMKEKASGDLLRVIIVLDHEAIMCGRVSISDNPVC